MVRLKAKQDHINDFIKASIADATGSVLNEPGCRCFDIIRDETDPTLFAFNEVYNDEAAFEHHKTTPHFKQWDAALKLMLDGAVEVSFCRPVFPLGNATWDAYPPGAVEDPFLEQHAITPVSDRIFLFAELPNAFRYLESGQHYGRTIGSIREAVFPDVAILWCS